ncbi:hypothetical protein Br6_04903 [Rhodococcus sp. Br-6]|nr:hypothetical protein Br6_04903 [Rhodococcus sp. Br-6]
MRSRIRHLVPSSGFLPGSRHRLRHCDIEVAIKRITTNAAAEQRRNLAIYAVRSLTQLDGLTDAAEAQLLPSAARTLRAACTDPVHVDVSTLGDWITEW